MRVVLDGGARRLPEHAASEWARESGATMIGPGCAIEAWPAARGALLLWDCHPGRGPRELGAGLRPARGGRGAPGRLWRRTPAAGG